jgi:hypothetical protein
MKVTFFENKKYLVGVCFFLLYQSSALCNDGVLGYQSLVENWLVLERQTTALKKNWRQTMPILKQRIKLLTAEKRLLNKQLNEQSSQKGTVENKREQLILQQSNIEVEQQEISLWLDNQWQKIQDTATQVAPPLYKTWQKKMSIYNEDLPTSEKLSLVLQIWKSKKHFDQKITQLQSVITTKTGKNILVEQLYLGSGLGWYVSADSTEYGLGRATPNGWQWHRPDADISQQVKHSIAMYRLQKEASFMQFPLAMLKPEEVIL